MTNPSNPQIRRRQFVGAILALASAAGAIISIVLSITLKSSVQVCNVVESSPSTYSVGGSGKCTVETFIYQYWWAFLILALFGLGTGLVAVFFDEGQIERFKKWLDS
jgi:hypothetical protein